MEAPRWSGGAQKDVDNGQTEPDFDTPNSSFSSRPASTLTATLIPPTLQPRRRYNGVYAVEFRGELIASDELSACRVLVRRGYSGKLTIIDNKTGKCRLIINDIAKAALLTVKESAWGPRFVRFHSHEEAGP
jgi:hypothetical protein